MRKNATILASVLALALTGCYNDPDITRRAPGQGQLHDGPSGGPGTTPGGSTAGPQRAAKEEAGHASVEPTHSGGRPPAAGTAQGKAEPSTGHATVAPHGAAAQTGNQPGVGARQTAPAPATQHTPSQEHAAPAKH